MLLIKNMKNLKYIILFALILACESSSDSIGSFSGNGVQSSTSGEGSSNTGIGGSMARFTIVGDYLYTVDSYNLKSFDISDKLNPEFREEVNLGWGVETIFPYDNNLFIGTQSGMHIYSLEKREKPSWISTYEHITSCDPVVVQGDYAYVTLRGGAECQNFNNQLDIIDISELEQPSLFKTYPMINPHGLGIDDNCLFITEGEYGLKMYDITNIDDIILKKHFKDISSIDVIPFMDVLMVIGSDGFHQYNYDCELGEIEYISTIPIKNL
tara:strand:+ start:278 stop:1084 length:807 start_codon:yes stop_codon:yes gene_type:complete